MYNQKFNREEYALTRETLLKAFEQNCHFRTFSKQDKVMFKLGEEVMQLIEGRAKVSAYSVTGEEKLLYILSPGDLMGEIDYFVEHSPDIEIIAMTDAKIRVISKTVFEAILAENPLIYRHIIISMIRKYQIIRSQLADNIFRDSKGKLAAFLLGLFSQEGQYVKDRFECYYIKHQDLAAILGCSRVTVTCILRDFIKEGILDIKENKFLLFSEEKLRSYV